MGNYNNIPKELIKLDSWCLNFKHNKIPYLIIDKKVAGLSYPGDYMSFDEASYYLNKLTNLGFVFSNQGYVGIDIDSAFIKNHTHKEIEEILSIFSLKNAYIELSRSEKGVHIITKGDLHFDGKNSRTGIEIYKNKRYFIMTGKKIKLDSSRFYQNTPILEAQEEINFVLKKYFASEQVEKSNNRGSRFSKNTNYGVKWELNGVNVPLSPTYPPIKQGSRNMCLTSVAGTLVNIGYHDDFIYQELSRANKQACKPPVSDFEIRGIVRSVSRYRKRS